MAGESLALEDRNLAPEGPDRLVEESPEEVIIRLAGESRLPLEDPDRVLEGHPMATEDPDRVVKARTQADQCILAERRKMQAIRPGQPEPLNRSANANTRGL